MTPDAFHYATRYAIRKEAGLQHRKSAEAPSGIVNGSNRDFFVSKKYVVDRNGDDVFDATDVVAYVDGSAVPVEGVNAESGLVKLVTAPTNGQVVTVDYQFSQASDADIDEVRRETEDWLTRSIKGYIDATVFANTPKVNYPMIFSTIVKLYAAALLLIRDYGSGADTDLTSKDGYKKLQLAKSMLSDWVAEVSDAGSTGTAAPRARVKTDGNIFRRERNLDDSHPDQDDQFMRKR